MNFLKFIVIGLGIYVCVRGFSASQLESPAGIATIDFSNPKRRYKHLRLGKRDCWVEQELFDDSPQLMHRALFRLVRNFDRAVKLLPQHSRPDLESIGLYLMVGPTARNGGKSDGLEYFREASHNELTPLIDESWSNCIVCYCAQNYSDLPDLLAQNVLVHELSHAYQMSCSSGLGTIYDAWKHAKRKGLYRDVTDVYGRHHLEAYALTNESEYFAELSTMYFDKCYYPPIERSGLMDYDPYGYFMIEKVWHIR